MRVAQHQVGGDLRAPLRAFVREVKALSGRFIEPAHAAHMVEHAQLVIQALRR